MKNTPILHAAEYAVYRMVMSVVRGLPHARVRRLGHRLGRLGYRVASGHRRRVMDHLELAMPELSAERRSAVARACFEHFGAHFLELVSMSRFGLEAADRRFDVEGWQHVEAAEAAGRGYFLTAGHFGHWELALYPLAKRIEGLHAVARPPDNPWIARDVGNLRQRLGIGIIDKAGASFRMLGAYRRGGRVAVVIDQHVRPSAGILVPFFGHPAWTSPVLAMLSLRTGAPVVHLTCVSAPGGRYRVSLRPPIEPEGEGPEAESALTRRYMEEIEHDIRLRPELWLWMHRRWRAGGPEARETQRRDAFATQNSTRSRSPSLAGSGAADAAGWRLPVGSPSGLSGAERLAGCCVSGESSEALRASGSGGGSRRPS